jgi:hypothetical protein
MSWSLIIVVSIKVKDMVNEDVIIKELVILHA